MTNSKLRVLLLIITMLCIITVVGCKQPSPITKKQADRIAVQTYKDYIKRKHISAKMFHKGPAYEGNPAPNGSKWWTYYYEFLDWPHDRLKIGVDNYGRRDVRRVVGQKEAARIATAELDEYVKWEGTSRAAWSGPTTSQSDDASTTRTQLNWVFKYKRKGPATARHPDNELWISVNEDGDANVSM